MYLNVAESTGLLMLYDRHFRILQPANEVWGKVMISEVSTGWVGFPTCITGHMTRRGSASGDSASRRGLHRGGIGQTP